MKQHNLLLIRTFILQAAKVIYSVILTG